MPLLVQHTDQMAYLQLGHCQQKTGLSNPVGKAFPYSTHLAESKALCFKH